MRLKGRIGSGMRVKIDKIVEAMESQSEEFFSYLNKRTGEVVGVSEEHLHEAEDGALDLEDRPDWERQAGSRSRVMNV